VENARDGVNWISERWENVSRGIIDRLVTVLSR
jgi:hypothetical protein